MKWYPERMSEVEIEIPNHYARRVTELLADEGFLQMEDISYLHSEGSETSGSNWQLKRQTSLQTLRNRFWTPCGLWALTRVNHLTHTSR